MVTEGCDEKALVLNSAEELHERIEKLHAVLTGVIRSKKPNKQEAQEWAEHVDAEINRALKLIALKEQHPKLEGAFIGLEALAHRADEELFRYGTKMRLPRYLP